jgi:hypothetical protein
VTVIAKPRRIQRKRTAGWRLPEGAVYVGRPGKWGNPFKLGEPVERDSDLWPYVLSIFPGADNPVFHGARFNSIRICRPEDVVEAHFRWFLEQPALMLTVAEELGGRDLACWCAPGEPCHADTLLVAARGWEGADCGCSVRPDGQRFCCDSLPGYPHDPKNCTANAEMRDAMADHDEMFHQSDGAR